MRPISSPEAEVALSRLAAANALFAFDFDGTLAPIVRQPGRAAMSTGVFRRLSRLARLAPVAVISGRSLADLRSRLPQEVLWCVGNHGSEWPGVDLNQATLHETCRLWIRQLTAELHRSRNDAGIVIEDKGMTLAMHFRLARDRSAAALRIADLASRLEPAPHVIGGKMVVNLLPVQAQTKFDALSRLAAQVSAEAVLFVGDDLTDEIVFVQAGPRWVTVRVEPDRGSLAQYFINHQTEIAGLLDKVIELCSCRCANAGESAGCRPLREDR